MRIVIQCAGSKHKTAGSVRCLDGRRVVFVADPRLASAAPGTLLAHPDDGSDRPGQTWRDLVIAANRSPGTFGAGLLAAAALYSPPAYLTLQRTFGVANVFILSAGWGLVRSDFLLPDYDITFSGSAPAESRRRRHHRFADFNALTSLPPDDTVFLGGKDYLPLFDALTAGQEGRRVVFFNSVVEPAIPGCDLRRFPTTRRTNWHYDCATALATGALKVGRMAGA
ncbi:MAG: hypothetical protein K2X46_09620 [Roseomonas sp.]|nr:hypothetical protein [Roseomonas sp.]